MAIINTNVMSLNAQRNLAVNSASLGTTIQRLSSGLRINSAKDDAAGLAIAERFTTQIRGLDQAARNANDGISLAQTAEGALGEVSNNLQRIRELAVQSRNATNNDSDREALQKEVTQLKGEIDRVAKQSAFNGTMLLDGSFSAQAFQVGANQGQTIDLTAIINAKIDSLGTWDSVTVPADTGISGTLTEVASAASAGTFVLKVGTVTVANLAVAAGDALTASAVDAAIAGNATALTTAGYTQTGTAADGTLRFSRTDGTNFTVSAAAAGGVSAAIFSKQATFTAPTANGEAATTGKVGFEFLSIATTAGADNAILAMDAALKDVNATRADLGAIQNRFESVIRNLTTTSENLSASRSRIRDADFAKETAELTRTQILTQAGTAMLAQANQAPQNILSLLRQ